MGIEHVSDRNWTYNCKPRESDFRPLNVAIRVAHTLAGSTVWEQVCMHVVYRFACRAEHVDNYYLHGDGKDASTEEKGKAYRWVVKSFQGVYDLLERNEHTQGKARAELN